MIMMWETHLLSAFALFWASSFGSTGALKCFTCRSDVKTNCGDPFYNVSVDMPSCGHEIMDQGVCTKTVTSEDVVIGGCGLKSFCQLDAVEDGCKETAGTTRYVLLRHGRLQQRHHADCRPIAAHCHNVFSSCRQLETTVINVLSHNALSEQFSTVT